MNDFPIARGAFVVSCQAREDNPLHGASFMAAMARAAAAGGAAAIRAEGVADIAAIRAAVDLPLIGLIKRWDADFPVYITPDLASARAAIDAGADIVAIDATDRPRRGETLEVLIPAIRALGARVLADVATEAEGLRAAALGADAVATTLSGYTDAAPAGPGPDLDLLSALLRRLDVPVLAEGRFTTPAEVAEALARGAHAVVVGTAITNPREIVRRFVAEIHPVPPRPVDQPAGPPRFLGLDAGGTATRWVLADATGAPAARGEVAPLTGHVFSAVARARARGIIADLQAAVRPHGRVAAILGGITGTGAGSPEAALLTGLFAERFAIPDDQVRIADDLWIAHRAAFPPGEGFLVYSGTGSAASHVGRDGVMLRVGGLGSVIDDGGSAFAIGRDALRQVLRREEEAPGAGWAGPLGQALARRLGGTEWDRVRAAVYGGDRASVAALAPAVAEAAAQAPAARAILEQAGQDLARLARILHDRLGPQPVALAGGGARLHPIIRATMQRVLEISIGQVEIDPAAAAARAAAEIACPTTAEPM
jgi:putative N-acetylmannosamine-6-phosphate epimerase/N-acetylglucosamine kinase-like BadF-type ATPase